MFFGLISFVISNPPIVIIPALYGSNLYATYGKGYSKHWYCPKHMDHKMFWVDWKYLIPPEINCFFELLRGYYDPVTDSVTSEPGLTIDIPDFGGVDSITNIDKGVFGHPFVEALGSLIELFKKHGYVVKKDLFGAPYDWRLAMVGIESTFYPKLKDLIELAFQKNNEKVTILGYSCGGMAIQRFLTKFVTTEWKEKYIKKVIFLAPAFAGSGATLNVAWNKIFPILHFLKLKSIADTAEASPCVQSLFPNHVVFQNYKIVDGPNGETLYPKDLSQFLIDHGKVSGNNILLLKKSEKIVSDEPVDIGVPFYLIYNSGISTEFGLKFKKSYKEEPERTFLPGDDVVPAAGPEYACNKWKAEKGMVCHNLNQKDAKFDHVGLGTNPFVRDLILNVTLNDYAIPNSKKFIQEQHRIDTDGQHYHIKDY